VSVEVEALAARALRRYLLSALPAKVTVMNRARAPVLEAAYAGPYTISGTMNLQISKTGVDSGYVTTGNFTAGSQSAAQLAATINATAGLVEVASADADGRLLLTGTPPQPYADLFTAAAYSGIDTTGQGTKTVTYVVDGVTQVVSFPAGSYTMQQLADVINAAFGSTVARLAASAVGNSYLVVRGLTQAKISAGQAGGPRDLYGAVPQEVLAPAPANGVIAVKDTTGAAALFGWSKGGEKVVHAPLVAPGYKGIADGLPLFPDMGPGFWVIIGKRSSVPVRSKAGSTVRTDQYQVGLELGFLYRQMNVQSHRSREGIASCVQCVRELLLTNAGRQLGRGGPAPLGDIVLAEEKTCTVEGVPFAFKGKDSPPGLFDRALMILSIRVFERPAA